MSRPRPGEKRVEKTAETPRGRRRDRTAVQSDRFTLNETLQANAATHQEAVAVGIALGTEKARLGATRAFQRFERWLLASGTDLDEVSEVVDSGRRRMPAVVMLAYASQIARPGEVQQRGHQIELAKAAAGLRARMVEVDGWDSPAVRSALSAIRSQLHVEEERPALPILPGDGSLAAIHSAIDELHLSQIQRAGLRAFNALGFWGGGRASEMIRHLRWKHVAVDKDRSRFTMIWPEGCKFQTEAVTLIRGTGLVADPLDAVEDLLKALRAEGLAPGPEDAIFPDLADGRRVLNPCDHPDADDCARWGEDAQAAKREAVTNWYRGWWQSAARKSGLTETPSRRISPHGLRRGLATAAALSGVPITEIQTELRHGTWIVTLRYTDEHCVDMSEVTALFELQDDLIAVDPAEVAVLAARRPDGRADDGRCGVEDDEGQMCSRTAEEYHTVHGHLCTLHANRSRVGRPFTAAVPLRREEALTEVEDDVQDPAGEPTRCCAAAGCPARTSWRRAIDGAFVWFCQDHARRHALNPEGAWDTLRVCDGINCDQTFGPRRAGKSPVALMRFKLADDTLRLCARCWSAARRVDDASDLASWAREPSLPAACELCEDGQEASLWITDGAGVNAGVCIAHQKRWVKAGRPQRLDDSMRAPIDRRRAKELSCVFCENGTAATGWLKATGGRHPVCRTHRAR